MEKIAKPSKIEFKKGTRSNEGIVSIEACYPGYGITLGNSLRRILLSSLSGAAVVGVKIKGADHEFMTIPHIKEDVLEIILNLKQLKLKIFSDEEIKLDLEAAGKKKVKAGDISKNSQVEIINKDLAIANITDMTGSLKIEIYVSQGKGYRAIENIEDKKSEIGHIDVDAAFSPVKSVGIKVENVRVGKMTNWEKLILDIVTDGTITPKEAFEKSVKILIDQFRALVGDKKRDKEEKDDQVKKDEEGDKHENTKTRKHENTKSQEEDKPEDEDKKDKAEEPKEDVSEEKPKKKRGRPKKIANMNE